MVAIKAPHAAEVQGQEARGGTTRTVIKARLEGSPQPHAVAMIAPHPIEALREEVLVRGAMLRKTRAISVLLVAVPGRPEEMRRVRHIAKHAGPDSTVWQPEL